MDFQSNKSKIKNENKMNFKNFLSNFNKESKINYYQKNIHIKRYKNRIFLNSFLLLIIIVLSQSLSSQIKLRRLESNSIIKLEINKIGNYNILSENFTQLPSEIKINDIPYEINNSSIYYLTSESNTIELIWNYTILSCENMFLNCFGISYINLENFITSSEMSMKNMFRDCSALNSLKFGNFNTSKVTDMSGMFQNCYSLNNLDLSKFDTSSVTNMKDMFNNCINLANLEITFFNASLVTEMNSMFYNCNSLKSLNLKAFTTSSSLNDTNSMFYNCSNLQSLDFNNFNTSNVIDMNKMFEKCYKLQNLNLNSFNTKSVTNMKDMFNECKNLNSLDIRNFDTSLVTDMNHMFYYCCSLNYLNLYNFNTSLVTNMNSMFFECHSLVSLNISKFKTKLVTSMEGMFKECNNLESLDLSSFNTKNVISMKDMFNHCHKLKSLNLNNFNTSLVEDMGWMFYNCYSLTSLNINKFDTSKVQNMQEMFVNCRSLMSLYLDNFYTPSLKNMSGMFKDCKSLKYLNLEHFNTSQVNDMNDLFNGCHSLVFLNLSSFDISKVINMNYMFYGCKSLIYLNVKNFDFNIYVNFTDMTTNINENFIYCINKYYYFLNSSNNRCNEECFQNGYKFIIDKNLCINKCENENNYKYEYNNVCVQKCPEKNIINTNLCEDDLICSDYYNYDYTECIEVIPEGYYCNDTLRKTINVCSTKCQECSLESENKNLCITCNVNNNYYPKFNDTSNINNFVNCYNSLEGYFLYENIYQPCYETCKQCNISGNKFQHNCIECYSNSTLNGINCYQICQYYHYFDSSGIYHCTENQECPNEMNKLIIDKNECVNNCSNYNLFEYNNSCYKLCPNKTFHILNKKICYDSILPNYYLNDSEQKIIAKCDNKCLNCSKESNEEELCIECNANLGYYSKNDNLNSNGFIDCYNEKPDGYYFDNISKVYNQCYKTCRTCDNLGNESNHLCTDCISNYILSEGNCKTEINDDCPYIDTTNNECLKECKSIEFFTNKCKINNNNTTINLTSINNIMDSQAKDNMITQIQFDITNKLMDSLLFNLTNGGGQDLLIKEENSDISYQITTSDNQNNNNYDNISSIILGACENILKTEYEINPNQSLLIFKIDYYKPGSKIPIIGYEVFHPESKIKLNLDLCREELIKYNIPVEIDENNLFKYDPNNEYYVDQCVPYTTENGTDIIINDRQDEYNNNNMSICEIDCTLIEYKSETKKSICQCGVKSKQLTISEIANQTNLLSNNFAKKSQSTNMVSMKCYYTLFTKDGMIKNIASYILLFMILGFIISGIAFYKCGFFILEDIIKKIMLQKEKEHKKGRFDSIETSTIRKSKKKKKMKIKIKGKNPPKKEKINTIFKEKFKNQLRKKLKSKITNKKDLNSTNNQKSIIKLTEKDLKNPIRTHSKKNNFNFSDYELNYLSYNDAKIYDKRSFCNYYCSLIKAKHPFIFSFCHYNDYNSFIIKINILMLSFCLYYFFNALFFNEPLIHKIYEDEGIYNFIYLVPYIAYSFIISHILIILIKYIFLSERNIEEIKMENSYLKALDKKDKVVKYLIIKYISFYISGFLFLAFLWYYLSSFGAVFQNTQIYLIKNTMISFGFSLIYPFIINFIPAILRHYSLSRNNSEFAFKISKYIAFI